MIKNRFINNSVVIFTLLQQLPNLRKQIADRDVVSPYVVFGDASLAELARFCRLMRPDCSK
jgi:superfamily II DNA helicase RecQ